jgi:thiol-disulfide isomerase/thioredoxin
VVAHQKEFEAGERKFNMAGKSLNGYEINKLWRNEGGGRRWSDVSLASGAGDVHDARGFAACDFDRDGDLDLFIRNYYMNSVYLRNEGAAGNWITIRPFGTVSNRSAIGTKIEVHAGGRKQVRWITAGSGYLSQHPNQAYFGLGESTRVERIRVTWPNGKVQEFGGAEANRHLALTEGAAGIVETPPATQAVLPVVDVPGVDALAAAIAGAGIVDLEGKPVDLSAQDRPILVNFWATWCNVCRSEFGDLNTLARDHAGAGLDLVGVAVLDPQGPELSKTCAELKPGFPVWTITRESYDRLFGAESAVPRAVLIHRGRVIEEFRGKIRPYLVKSYLLEVLRGR